MNSPIYAWTKKMVGELEDNLLQKVISWEFLHAGKRVSFELPNGKKINYQGIKFSGSPRLVFWSSFIEPFLTEGIIRVLREVGLKARQAGASPEQCIRESATMLQLVIARTYAQMAKTSSKLSGDGITKGPLQDVEPKISLMSERLDADHSGVSSFQGIGTTHYGMRDIRRDGSYLTTEWMIFFYIPLIPLASRRIIVGSSKSQHRVFFLTHKKSYRVIERLRRPDLVQVLSVYSFTLFYIAWIVAGCVWWNVADADRFSGTLKMAMIIFSPWAIPYAHAKWEIHKASGKLV